MPIAAAPGAVTGFKGWAQAEFGIDPARRLSEFPNEELTAVLLYLIANGGAITTGSGTSLAGAIKLTDRAGDEINPATAEGIAKLLTAINALAAPAPNPLRDTFDLVEYQLVENGEWTLGRISLDANGASALHGLSGTPVISPFALRLSGASVPAIESDAIAHTLLATGQQFAQREEHKACSVYAADTWLSVEASPVAKGATLSVAAAQSRGFRTGQTLRIYHVDDSYVYRHGAYELTNIAAPYSITLDAPVGPLETGESTFITGAPSNAVSRGDDIFFGGVWLEITGIISGAGGTRYAVTALGKPYHDSDAIAPIGAAMVMLNRPATFTLVKKVGPNLSGKRASFAGEVESYAGNIPDGAIVTNKTMLDRVPDEANRAVVGAVESHRYSELLAEASLAPSPSQEAVIAAQQAYDYLRWSIGQAVNTDGEFSNLDGGGLYEGAYRVGAGGTFTVTSLPDLYLLQMYSPMAESNRGARIVVSYSAGATA